MALMQPSTGTGKFLDMERWNYVDAGRPM